MCIRDRAWIGLDWAGLDWIGLDWVGWGWIGLDWDGLGWIGLDWLGLAWTGFGLDWVELRIDALLSNRVSSRSSGTLCGSVFSRFSLPRAWAREARSETKLGGTPSQSRCMGTFVRHIGSEERPCRILVELERGVWIYHIQCVVHVNAFFA